MALPGLILAVSCLVRARFQVTGVFVVRLAWSRWLTALAVACLAAGACAPPAAVAGPLRVVDDAGDTVSLAGPARRVASLIPAATELLFAIGAGPQVIGRSAWCDYPASVAAVANLGDGINPNVEAIVGARPDLVVLYESPQNTGAAARLRALGIPTVRLRTDRLADVPRHARLLGILTGHTADADTLSRRFQAQLDSLPPTTDPHAPSVFFLVWDQPPTTIGGGSYLSELVSRAGARNTFADLAAPSGTVSIEVVAARDPDLVFWFSETPPAFAERPEWKAVRAIRERRFLEVHGSEFNRPSPRAPQAIRTIAERVRALR